jgi:hypothetical protein
MKRLIALLGLFLLWPGALVPAQELDEAQSKNLFRTGAATHPGIKLRIELLREGQRRFVPLDTVFHSGDRVKLHFAANFPAYVEIYNHGSDGRREKLFPYAGLPARVKVTAPYVVPVKATEWFEFDATPGTERLSFLFTAALPTTKPAPKPAAKPRLATGGTVAVNPDDEPAVGGKDVALGDQHDAAIAEGKNLKRVQTADDCYFFGTAQRVRRVVGVVLNLQHR